MKTQPWKCCSCGNTYETYERPSYLGIFKARICGRCRSKGLDQTKKVWIKK